MALELHLDCKGSFQFLRTGLSGPLLWLQNCLNRTADKREDAGTSIAVPLVPLSEENEDAMEHEMFQKLLKKVGIRPPANEQESFWRISANLNVQQLRRIASVITLHDGGWDAVERNEDVSADQRSEVWQAQMMARERNATPAKVDDESKGRTDQADDSPSGSDSETKGQVMKHSFDLYTAEHGV
eukprot:g32024.t1